MPRLIHTRPAPERALYHEDRAEHLEGVADAWPAYARETGAPCIDTGAIRRSAHLHALAAHRLRRAGR